MKHLVDAIIMNCSGILEIDLKRDRYRTCKEYAPLRQIIPPEGSYKDLCQKVLFADTLDRKDLPPDYMPFVELGAASADYYSCYVPLRSGGEKHDLLFSFFPDNKNGFAYLLIREHLPGFSETTSSRAKEYAYDANFLYSMVVDLDDGICRSVRVPELDFRNTGVSVHYKDWSSRILPAIREEYREAFSKYTDPAYIRAELSEPGDIITFDIQMTVLSGECIWTRHTISRTPAEAGTHFQFLYTVQNIDRDKKEVATQINQIEERSKYDTLTQAYTRKQIEELLKKAAADPSGSVCSLICFNLKNLEDIYASYFHQVTDQILATFSAFLKRVLPKDVLIGRYMMASFICICPDTTLEGAEALANMVLSRHQTVHYTPVSGLGLAIGVAELIPGEKVGPLLQRIDKTIISALEKAGDSIVTERDLRADAFARNSDAILNKIESELHRNYAENLTLKELADRYYMNSAYLGQLFARRHGISFNQYLRNIRMSHALFLLTHTDKFIYEIIEEVGFSNITYFNKHFTELYGMPPAKYRKLHAQKNKVTGEKI